MQTAALFLDLFFTLMSVYSVAILGAFHNFIPVSQNIFRMYPVFSGS